MQINLMYFLVNLFVFADNRGGSFTGTSSSSSSIVTGTRLFDDDDVDGKNLFKRMSERRRVASERAEVDVEAALFT